MSLKTPKTRSNHPKAHSEPQQAQQAQQAHSEPQACSTILTRSPSKHSRQRVACCRGRRTSLRPSG